jgi:hypothetical protein
VPADEKSESLLKLAAASRALLSFPGSRHRLGSLRYAPPDVPFHLGYQLRTQYWAPSCHRQTGARVGFSEGLQASLSRARAQEWSWAGLGRFGRSAAAEPGDVHPPDRSGDRRQRDDGAADSGCQCYSVTKAARMYAEG